MRRRLVILTEIIAPYRLPVFNALAMRAKRHGVPLLLWSESTAYDIRRHYTAVEFSKLQFRRLCRAFVAAGKSSRDYLLFLGAPDRSIFIAPDAVDVQLFSTLAERARQNQGDVLARHGLPSRYFLYVGRLVEEKGVFDLLSAYAKLDEDARSQIGLVFAGDGPARSELMHQAGQISPGEVRFCGWVH